MRATDLLLTAETGVEHAAIVFIALTQESQRDNHNHDNSRRCMQGCDSM